MYEDRIKAQVVRRKVAPRKRNTCQDKYSYFLLQIFLTLLHNCDKIRIEQLRVE